MDLFIMNWPEDLLSVKTTKADFNQGKDGNLWSKLHLFLDFFICYSEPSLIQQSLAHCYFNSTMKGPKQDKERKSWGLVRRAGEALGPRMEGQRGAMLG